ncbi:MAG: discoidin domain-containing protein [Kiritimatiellae bacterium]|nr:discoidin domain-containing protein [Kiritimatiellia bacterium]
MTLEIQSRYLGNPHVRFDEGEVAPAATPRRGSLLYTAEKILAAPLSASRLFVASTVVLGAVFGAAATALATDYTWNGAAGGYWGSDNWNSGEAWGNASDSTAIFDNNEPARVLVDIPVVANKIDADVDTTLEKGVIDPDATAYRYFRFYVDAPKSAGRCMQLSDVMLLDSNGGEIPSSAFTLAYDTDAHGVSDGAYPGGEAPDNAVDGNRDTKWLDYRAGLYRSEAARAAVYIEFQFADAINLSGYRWYTANDDATRDPVAWRLLASNDGASWTTIDKVTGYNPPTDRKVLAFQRSFAGFTKYRFKVDAVRGDGTQYMQISDVGLFDEDGARLTDFTFTSGDNNTNGNEGPEKAVDVNSDGTGDTGTKWGNRTSNGNTGNLWIQLDLPSPKNLSKYNWYTANDTAEYSGRQPKGWRLLASNDGETWAPIDFQENRTDITITNFAKAYEKSFVNETAMSLSVGEFDVADAKTLAVRSGIDISHSAGIWKNGAGTLRLGDGEGATSVKPENGFGVAAGTLDAKDVTFRLGGTATANKDAPFVVANGANATAVLNGGSIYSVATGSGDYNAFQVGAGEGGNGSLYATNVNVTARGRIRLATGQNATAYVEKSGGDWKVQENDNLGRFLMGQGSGSRSEFYHRGGTLETWSYICVGCGGDYSYFELDGGTVTQAHNNDIRIGDTGPSTARNELRVKSGTLKACTNIRVASGAPGILTVDGGEVNAANGQIQISFSSDSGSVALNGGVLKTQAVVHGGGVENGTFVFNGGTLQAVQDGDILQSNAKLVVKVADGGAKIDTAGHAVLASATIAPDAESTGGLLAFGGGSLALAAGSTYAGATTVELGTMVKFASASDIPAGGIAVALPAATPEEGVYTVFTLIGDGETFAANAPESVAKPEGCALRLSGDSKSILCIYGNPDNSWIGAADGGDLSTAANWSLGFVPTDGSVVISAASAATFTKGDTFAPEALTVASGSAAITIAGAFDSLAAIVNNSSSDVTFTGLVDFGTGNIDVTQTAAFTYPSTVSGGRVVFAGGVRGVDVANHNVFSGDYTLTTTDPWSPPDNAVVTGGSTLRVDNFLDTHRETTWSDGSSSLAGDPEKALTVMSGGEVIARVATIDTQRIDNGGNSIWAVRGYLVKRNDGVFRVTEQCTAKGIDRVKNGKDGVYQYSTEVSKKDGSGTFYFGRFHLDFENSEWWHVKMRYSSGTEHIVLGSGGLTSSKGRIEVDGNGLKLSSSADWTFGARSVEGSKNKTQVIRGQAAQLELDTADYDNPEAPGHTITVEGLISEESNKTMPVNVVGNGVVDWKVASNIADWQFEHGITVKDTATLKVNPGYAAPGKGAVTVESGAALAVASSGTLALAGNLTLADGATLAFNFTDRRTAPVLDLEGKTVTLGGEKRIKVSLSGERPAYGTDGKYFLTSGGGFTGADIDWTGSAEWVKSVGVDETTGNLVMAKPIGFVILFK